MNKYQFPAILIKNCKKSLDDVDLLFIYFYLQIGRAEVIQLAE